MHVSGKGLTIFIYESLNVVLAFWKTTKASAKTKLKHYGIGLEH